MARLYESLTDEEVIPPGGEWIIEFQFSPKYCANFVSKEGWRPLMESWWVVKDGWGDAQKTPMLPRPLESLVASRASKVFRSAIACGDVTTWRFRNVTNDDVVVGELFA